MPECMANIGAMKYGGLLGATGTGWDQLGLAGTRWLEKEQLMALLA